MDGDLARCMGGHFPGPKTKNRTQPRRERKQEKKLHNLCDKTIEVSSLANPNFIGNYVPPFGYTFEVKKRRGLFGNGESGQINIRAIVVEEKVAKSGPHATTHKHASSIAQNCEEHRERKTKKRLFSLPPRERIHHYYHTSLAPSKIVRCAFFRLRFLSLSIRPM